MNEIYLYGDIGGKGISPTGFAAQLAALNGADVTVRINSQGGGVSDGIAIANLLKGHAGKVTAQIDGIAASIAAVVAMAASEIVMGSGSMMMVHMPLIDGVSGGASDFRKAADYLDKTEAAIVEAYTARTKRTHEEIRALMQAETYMSAEDAVAGGFADSVAKVDESRPGSPMNFFNTYKNAAPISEAFNQAKIDFTAEAFGALLAKAQVADQAEALIADAIAKAGADVEAAKAALAAAEAALAKANADHAAEVAAAAEASAAAVLKAENSASLKAANMVASMGHQAPINNSKAAANAPADAKGEYQNLLASNPTAAAVFFAKNKAAIISK